LITQAVAMTIRSDMDIFNNMNASFPAVLEIPSKNMEYNAKMDPIIQRVQMFFGSNPVMEMDFNAQEEK